MNIVWKRGLRVVCLVLFAQILCPLPAEDKLPGAGGSPRKKLIEFGWDEPDPIFIQKYAEAMRKSPFDGTVFHINCKREDGTTARFTWEGWGTQQFREADLEPFIRPMREAKLGGLRHNFLRFNVTPAGLDWFDDHSAILENARLAAWFARKTNCPGLLFDVEQYQGKLFQYPKQRDAQTKTYGQYASQARLRGRQVMQAFQKGYPGLTVFLTGSYSHLWRQVRRGRKLPEMVYGLMPPFLDGLLEAAEGKTKIVDGHESGYGYTSPEQFQEAYQIMQKDVLPLVADPVRYAHHFSFSFGIWMDKDSTEKGWSVDDFSKNGHSPETLEKIVAKALQTADEYVWLYTEKPRWWTSPGGAPDKLPSAYEAAVRRGKAAGTSSNTAGDTRDTKGPNPR
jgi:hypothetical protein